MTDRPKPKRKRTTLDRVGDAAPFLIVAGLLLEDWDGSPMPDSVARSIQLLALGLAMGHMIWQLGRRTELERLIFYQASTFAFCAAVVIGLGHGILEELGVVEAVSASNFAAGAGVAWFAAMLFLRWRNR